MHRTKESLLPYSEKSAYTLRHSCTAHEELVRVSELRREHMQVDAANEEGVDYAGSRHKKITAADSRTLLGASSSSRRGLSGKGVSELNERGSSRRSLNTPPSWLIDHSACVGTCPYTSYAEYLHPPQPDVAGEGIQAATSAPAWTSKLTTWQGINAVTCQAAHTFHHHHYHYFTGTSGIGGPMGCRHAYPATDSCCEINSPHDLSSHEGPPKTRTHECPVNNPPGPPAPPVTSSQSKRFVEKDEEDLYAVPSLTVFKAKCSLKHYIPELTPFPSTHGLPLVLCQHCSHLLLLPPGTSPLLPPSGNPLLHHLLYVKLKCGYCLNISKFSTRHLHRASPSPPIAGSGSPSPLPPVREPVEITSMPSCSTSNGIIQEAPELKHVETEELLNDISEEFNNVTVKVPINANAEHTQEYNNYEARERCNGVRVHTLNQEQIETGEPLYGICEYSQLLNNGNGEQHSSEGQRTEAEEPLNGIYEDSSQLKHVETGAPGNGKCGDTLQGNDLETGVFCNGIPECSLELSNVKTEVQINGRYGHTSQVKDVETGESVYSISECNGASVLAGVSKHESQPEREPEITAFSSVQYWMDSLTVESGFETDSQLQGASNCQNGCVDGFGKVATSHRPALHQHFGYNSPSELFEKLFSSEDEEIKTRTESNSIASSSSSSNNACQQIASVHVHAPSLYGWNAANMNPDSSSLTNGIISPVGEEQDSQRSLACFLKRGLLQKGRLLSASPKTRVVVNGHVLSSAAVKQAEERAGKLRTGSYWYDCKAGFWGVEGGPGLGILPPFIEELNYPMLKNCSNGDTQVYINGRELHVKDLVVLSQRGLSRKAGRAYVLGFDGVLVDETTGLELKRLGKLGPTVEQRGKGFGMFTVHVLK